jgi:GTP-binding protein
MINHSKYIGSYPSVEKLPKSTVPEIAFCGRSNVGKSSLLNYLCNSSKLAKVSGRPGKTQMINQFLIEESWKLVDLPGYGYAKISKKHRASLAIMIDGYVFSSPQLKVLMVLIDSRIAPQKIDLEFMYKLGEKGVPFAMCFTKCDNLDPEHEKRMEAYKEKLSESWEELPLMFQTSSTKKHGKEAVIEWFEEVVLK